MVEYEEMTVAQLKDVLRERELPVSGKKAELIARLQEADDAAEEEFIDEVDEGNFFAEDPAIALLGAYGTALVAVIARVDGSGRLTP